MQFIKEIQSIVMGIFNAILGNASEVTIEKVSKEFEPILIDGEQIEKAYKVIRDMFILQTKRLILVEKQGVTGSKVDYQSIPYSSIKKFSKESGGILDLDAELKFDYGEITPIKKSSSERTITLMKFIKF
jgi:hypothetical protein